MYHQDNVLPDRNAIYEVYPITSSESLINSTELSVQRQSNTEIKREQELRVSFIGDDSYTQL